MPDHAGGEAAAAVRQWSHWRIVVAKISVASEYAVFLAEVVVQPRIELVLIIGFGRRQHEIVGGARQIRNRVVLQHLKPQGIEARDRNGIVRKRLARRRRWIEDGRGEDALPL